VSSELVMIEQHPGTGDAAPWILDRHGRRMQGRDDGRRSAELHSGLERHARVRPAEPDVSDETLEAILSRLHEPRYLRALRQVSTDEPTLLPEWAPPGLPADSPVWAGVVATAFEGVRTAVAAAQQLVAGARFAYAVCRPPGHHAGPAWMGGYCYLNTAAAAAQALCDGDMRPVAILDLDFHFPTGTAAVVARMDGVSLHSLHASTLENVPWRAVPEREHERFVDFQTPPDTETYLRALRGSIEAIEHSAAALVLSLGYDTVGGDPHGSWSFPPAIFTGIGALLASCGLPLCVVQEGGYALDSLAACSHAFAAGLLDGEGGR
jgi:acetoin utilization deacetylase AcuC-like enzyme